MNIAPVLMDNEQIKPLVFSFFGSQEFDLVRMNSSYVGERVVKGRRAKGEGVKGKR